MATRLALWAMRMVGEAVRRVLVVVVAFLASLVAALIGVVGIVFGAVLDGEVTDDEDARARKAWMGVYDLIMSTLYSTLPFIKRKQG
ncbi:MAG: hypothetical protein Q8R28_23260 [Dehalococcoidia bacterium]|nr:hypothetical protein [Dehalococcoidia bacterium]